MNNLISEVAVVSAQEKAMLDECEALLNFATAMQVRVMIYMADELCTTNLSIIFYVKNEHKLVGNKFHLHVSQCPLCLILFYHFRRFNVRSHMLLENHSSILDLQESRL